MHQSLSCNIFWSSTFLVCTYDILSTIVSKFHFTFAVPPHIIGDGIHDITLKKGRPIRYDIWFGGEPAPSVEWSREGRVLATDEHTSLELYSKNTIYTERNTVLSIPKVSNILQLFTAHFYLMHSHGYHFLTTRLTAIATLASTPFV